MTDRRIIDAVMRAADRAYSRGHIRSHRALAVLAARMQRRRNRRLS